MLPTKQDIESTLIVLRNVVLGFLAQMSHFIKALHLPQIFVNVVQRPFGRNSTKSSLKISMDFHKNNDYFCRLKKGVR